MRNTDNDLDPSSSSHSGRVLHSGIQPEHGLEAASYALPHGAAALEGEGVERPLPRRRFLGLGAGLLLAGGSGILTSVLCGGGAAVASAQPRGAASPADPPPSDLLLRGARSLARGRLRDLVQGSRGFLYILEEHGPTDPQLWQGVERLARYALLEGRRAGRRLGRRLLLTMQNLSAPAAVAELGSQLEDLCWHDEEGR